MYQEFVYKKLMANNNWLLLKSGEKHKPVARF